MMKRVFISLLLPVILLSQACKGPEGPVGPQGPPGEGFESLVDPAIPPKIIYTFPPANSIGPYDGFTTPLLVRFNKIMDVGSVRRAVTLTSALDDISLDSSQIWTLGGDQFILNPQFDASGNVFGYTWALGQSYRLSIALTAKDCNGNTYPGSSMEFMPEPYFRVTRYSPGNGAIVSPLYTPINLEFNSPIDTTIFSRIVIRPTIPGTWYYSSYYNPRADSQRIRFDLSAELLDGTTYTVSLSDDIQDKQGNRLHKPFALTFTTEQFQIEHTSPSDGQVNIDLETPIGITCSDYLDTATVRSCITITPNTDGSLGHLDDLIRYFNFSPTDDLIPETQYSVTVDTTLRSRTGARMSAPYMFSFWTAPFRVDGTYPGNGETNVPISLQYVVVWFNGKYDTASVRPSFSMPGADGVFDFRSPDEIYYRFANGALSPGTTYRVTISDSLRSRAGFHIKAPYSFSFSTES